MCAACAWPRSHVQAQQQVRTGTSFGNVSDSFYEGFGFSGALRGPNWFANWGGAATPPFGNFNPQAGASTGFGIQGKGWNGAFGFTAAQGFSRTNSMQSAGVTVMNGQSGTIIDQQFSPFVIGVVPVVGDQGPWGEQVPTYSAIPWQIRYQQAVAADAAEEQAEADAAANAPPPRRKPIDTLKLSKGDATPAEPARAVEASAAAGRSVAEIRAAQHAEEAQTAAEALDYWVRGQDAEADGKLGVAKIYYQMAARRAGPELRSQIEARLKSMARRP